MAKALQNVYLPNRSHSYFPIETKKSAHQFSQMQPQQPPLRMQKARERQIDILRKNNQQLRQRQQIYIDKLMKLEEGLQNQHTQFIKLQELYTQLFQSYKQKQSDVVQLEMRYRQTERHREQERNTDDNRSKDSFRSNQSREKQYSFRQQQWHSKQQWWQKQQQQWKRKQQQWQSKQKQFEDYINDLAIKVSSVNESYERVVQQLAVLKSRDKNNAKNSVSYESSQQQMKQWIAELENEKQIRMKMQYENEFLRNRNKDLQSEREQLQKLLGYKQKQIAKLREDKIKIHRQSCQKLLQRSPSKLGQSKVSLKPAKEKQERQVRQQINLANMSIDSGNNQYFSFSREKQQYSIDSELPSFPPELEIDSLINEHKK